MTDGTGAGVLLEDLDADGNVDIVLPNLSGDTSIFWNEGGLNFTKAALTDGRFRQAITADVNDDGFRDILLTTGVGPPLTFAGSATPRTYTFEEFRTSAVTYSAAAADLEGDGWVQIITGSYNAELTQNRDPRALTGNGVGSAVHQTSADGVETEFLTGQAQALVTLAVDIDSDGRQDVIVGNDLGTPDKVWLGSDIGLVASELFDTTTLSTMSIDVVDLDNDGDKDVIATDMAPMATEAKEPWESVVADIEAARIDEIQEPQNKLQINNDGESFTDQAVDFGVAATGWTWSSVAGDLDNDGLQDVYVVNGMQAITIFEDLEDGRLVESNQAFRNTGSGLDPMPAWGLGDTAGGRGMAQADMDGDGDLDIVVNNLGDPAKVWENQLCGGDSVLVELRWDDVQNSDVLGAEVRLATGDEEYLRDITSTRGYLSSPPTQAHFGLGETDGKEVRVIVTWPDGASSIVEDISVNQIVTLTRVEGPLVSGQQK